MIEDHLMRSTHGVTRRQILGGLAAGSIAMPTIVPSTVFGNDDKAPPSERITVGFIGCGKMANDYHLPELLGFGDVQAVAVCEVDTKRREHAKKRVEKAYSGRKDYKGCASYVDFRELIGRKDIDAVCIATPEHWHAIPAIEAMKAGKDVYCEKPLTLTLAEGKRCIDVARKYERVFQTGSQQRSNVFGDFRQAAEFIRSGRLGTIRTVTVGVGGPSKWCDLKAEEMEPGLDWDLWLGPAPKRPYNSTLSPRGVHNHFPAWRDYREYAGGGHSDMGAHHYDIVQWCLGMDEAGPVEILPPMSEHAHHGVVYRYANGVVMVHGGPSGCTFTGDKERSGSIATISRVTRPPSRQSPSTKKRFISPSLQAIIVTGWTASALASVPSLMWRLAHAPSRSRSSATWLTGTDGRYAGTRSSGNSWMTPWPIAGSTASAGTRGSFPRPERGYRPTISLGFSRDTIGLRSHDRNIPRVGVWSAYRQKTKSPVKKTERFGNQVSHV